MNWKIIILRNLSSTVILAAVILLVWLFDNHKDFMVDMFIGTIIYGLCLNNIVQFFIDKIN
jgi:hypothetical protein